MSESRSSLSLSPEIKREDKGSRTHWFGLLTNMKSGSVEWLESFPPKDISDNVEFFKLLNNDREFAQAMIDVIRPNREYYKINLTPACANLILWSYGYNSAFLHTLTEPFEEKIKTPSMTLDDKFNSLKNKRGPAQFDECIKTWPQRDRENGYPLLSQVLKNSLDSETRDIDRATSIFILLTYTLFNVPNVFKHAEEDELRNGRWASQIREEVIIWGFNATTLPFYKGLILNDSEAGEVSQQWKPLVPTKSICEFIAYRNTLKSERESCWNFFRSKESDLRKDDKIAFLNELTRDLPHVNNRAEIQTIVTKALEKYQRALLGNPSNVRNYLQEEFSWLDLNAIEEKIQRKSSSTVLSL